MLRTHPAGCRILLELGSCAHCIKSNDKQVELQTKALCTSILVSGSCDTVCAELQIEHDHILR